VHPGCTIDPPPASALNTAVPQLPVICGSYGSSSCSSRIMSFGEHALMKNARNHDAFRFLPVKHDVPAMLMTAQTGANVITKSA